MAFIPVIVVSLIDMVVGSVPRFVLVSVIVVIASFRVVVVVSGGVTVVGSPLVVVSALGDVVSFGVVEDSDDWLVGSVIVAMEGVAFIAEAIILSIINSLALKRTSDRNPEKYNRCFFFVGTTSGGMAYDNVSSHVRMVG